MKDSLFHQLTSPVIQSYGPPQELQVLKGRVMQQGMNSGAAGLQGLDVNIQVHLAFHHGEAIESKEPT